MKAVLFSLVWMLQELQIIFKKLLNHIHVHMKICAFILVGLQYNSVCQIFLNCICGYLQAVEMRLKILLRKYIDILPSALAFAIIFRILSHFVSCDLYCESQMYYWMLCHKLLYRIFCDQGTASQIPLFKAWIIITIIFFFFYFFTYGFLSYITGYKLIRLTDFA